MGSNSLFVMIVASYKKKMIPFWVVSIVMVVPPFMDGLNMFKMENPILKWMI
jgi:predicted histidine transporter YuiF (NhaC family)